ncbi:ICOS ligand-like isoform X2 [Myripristis murdjan]|nr:ICOS ligand-like isoform X2 [Myripristis murdjan]
MPALWRTGLLFSFITSSSCLGKECVFGLVGRPVSLSCITDEANVNVSIEWNRDDEMVLRSQWDQMEVVMVWYAFYTNMSTTLSTATGNLSLKLSTVYPKHGKTYRLFITGEDQDNPLCTMCFRRAASFSYPVLQREDSVDGDETVFVCQSSGGFPEPEVSWLINKTEQPPNSSVQTQVALLPDSSLYNITSHLTINISQDTSVSCIIENQPMNETLTSTSYAVQVSKVVNRASEAMWIFSTALCVVVGLMVLAGLAYQIYLDRMDKKHYQPDRGYRGTTVDTEETVGMNSEPVRPVIETDV